MLFECFDYFILFDDKYNDYRLIVYDGGFFIIEMFFFYGVVKNYKIIIYNNFSMV